MMLSTIDIFPGLRTSYERRNWLLLVDSIIELNIRNSICHSISFNEIELLNNKNY